MRSLVIIIPGMLAILGLAYVGLVCWINPPLINGRFIIDGFAVEDLLTIETERDWWPFAWDSQARHPVIAVRAEGRMHGVFWGQPIDVAVISSSDLDGRIWWSEVHAHLSHDQDGVPVLEIGDCYLSRHALRPLTP